ncbi:MAG TPA: glycosyltransferase family 1 protein [Thermomicrobiaceae bacterium]|nr:glycosyltransferase family 1 protein [Thermomicrobiaceae bacterium]
MARLIGAFARLAAEDAELGLVLVGKAGWLEGEIEAALAASPARARIGRTGHVPDADLPALYGGAAAFALPSLYEGFGMPVLEAMACGAPVVVSDRGSLPEIAGAAAEIVDPLDVAAIARGIERALDPASRERRVAAGRRRAAEFTWERAGALTLAAIEQAAGERRK